MARPSFSSFLQIRSFQLCRHVHRPWIDPPGSGQRSRGRRRPQQPPPSPPNRSPKASSSFQWSSNQVLRYPESKCYETFKSRIRRLTRRNSELDEDFAELDKNFDELG